MKMNWGRISVSGNSTTSTITFQSQFGTLPYSIVITPEATTTGNMDGWGVSSRASTGFKITNGYGSTTTYGWIAIGIQ
jgi:hypothetical protein